MASVIVKLNEGVSGEGNALVDLRGLPAPGVADERGARHASGCARWSSSRRTTPVRRLPRQVRARAAASSRSASPATELRSPSVQLRVTARRRGRAAVDPRPAARRRQRAELPGLRVPGRPGVRAADQPSTPRRSGERLAEQGALGPLRDRLRRGARRTTARWTPYAIELNLRKGGTTHPFLTLQFLTDGRYDAATGAVPHARAAARSTSSPPTTSSPTQLRGAERRRPVRHRGPARAALRPVAADRGRVPHDQLPHRARPGRPHRGRGHPEEAEATYQRAQRLLLTAARDALEEAPLRI